MRIFLFLTLLLSLKAAAGSLNVQETLNWIGLETGNEVNLENPIIVHLPRENLCGILSLRPDCKVTAAYLPEYEQQKDVILLLDTFNENSREDQSKLVHELVHWVQAKNNKLSSDCENLNQTETQAFEVQLKWIDDHGSDPRFRSLIKFSLASLANAKCESKEPSSLSSE